VNQVTWEKPPPPFFSCSRPDAEFISLADYFAEYDVTKGWTVASRAANRTASDGGFVEEGS